MDLDHLAPTLATVPVENLADVVFEYSADRRRLRVRLPAGANGVVVDLSRSAAVDLAEKVGARVVGMADPVVPAQPTCPWPAMVSDGERRR
jgi:hypothetical protein